MNEKKYLAKNIGFLTISQFGTKLLSFFLVPLYTYILTTAEYGTYDLNTTTVSLMVPILTCNIADSLLRYPLDKGSNKKQIFTVGIKYYFISLFIAGGLVLINDKLSVVPILCENSVLLYLLFAVTSLSGILINFSRGLDKIKHTAISGVLCSSIIILLNILFLVILKMGLKGYFLANILGAMSQCIYLVFAIRMWKYTNFRKVNHSLEKEMLEYASPLLVNGISWWVSSASDRYIVTWLRGVAENGIYSVGYKIPSILNIFQTIFSQAWTLSAIHDYDPEDKNHFFTDMYNFYNFCMIFVCAVLIVLTKIMAKILYARDFYIAWQYVPFLLIAIVFGAISGYIGGIFAAVKDTKVFAKTSIIGAIINVVLNIVLIETIGTIGAAISTALCYAVIWYLRVINVKKYIILHINLKRDILAYVLLLVQSILFFVIKSDFLLYFCEIILLGVIWTLYLDVAKPIIYKFKGKLVRR